MLSGTPAPRVVSCTPSSSVTWSGGQVPRLSTSRATSAGFASTAPVGVSKIRSRAATSSRRAAWPSRSRSAGSDSRSTMRCRSRQRSPLRCVGNLAAWAVQTPSEASAQQAPRAPSHHPTGAAATTAPPIHAIASPIRPA